MLRRRKGRKLPPHQYKLKLRVIEDPKLLPLPKQHLIYEDGQWHIYRNKWKSQFRGPKLYAACITAPTIAELQAKIRKSHDGWKFGKFHLI